MSRSLIVLTLHTLGLFLVPEMLLAQKPDSASMDLKEVVVQDYRLKASDEFREQSLDIDSMITGRASLAEALRKNTAIFVKSYGGNGVATLSLRGTSGYHTKLYWNNVDLGSPMLGLADLSVIPASGIDEINVQYGFASLNDGTGGIGGSIRMNNRFPSSSEPVAVFSLYGGSFGQLQGNTRINLSVDKLSLQAGVLRYTARNDFPFKDISEAGNPEKLMANAQFDQASYWANAYYRIDNHQLLSLKTWVNKVDRKLPQNLNGNQKLIDSMKDKSVVSVAEYLKTAERSTLVISSGMVAADNQFVSGGDSTSYLNQYWSWQNSLRYHYNFTDRLSSESGGRFRLENARSPSYSAGVLRNQGSVFTSWQYSATTFLKLNLLLREEWVNGQASPLLGSAGMVYEINKSHSSRMHIARNYRFPSLNDLFWNPGGNKDLAPEHSYNFEWGYSYHAEKTPLLEVAVFHNLIDNWIQWTPNQSLWSPQNVRKVANTGVELNVKDVKELGKVRLGWQINYSYTRSRTLAWNTASPENLYNQLPYVPFHLLTTGVDLRYAKYFLRYQHNLNGKYFTNTDNSVYMPAFSLGYFTLGIDNITRSHKHKVGLNMELNNLFGYDYQILPYRPEPGFHLGFRLTYSLSK